MFNLGMSDSMEYHRANAVLNVNSSQTAEILFYFLFNTPNPFYTIKFAHFKYKQAIFGNKVCIWQQNRRLRQPWNDD